LISLNSKKKMRHPPNTEEGGKEEDPKAIWVAAALYERARMRRT